jgi:exodeoxyribonuclease-1
MTPPRTFLWHDYETFGAHVRRDRPAQFAAIRTNEQLQPISEPLVLYCQPANDFLPDPLSCLITGITPQLCLQRGVPEYQFAAAIEPLLAQPGTIGVGYNTIRFDDEITRFMLWRNLLDPYAREWQNQCGRWDLLDVLRTAYALRPAGMSWPTKPDGTASFKLGDLAAANGLAHEAAHDALSDVQATIALAQRLQTAQPKLFDFCLALHKKDRVAAELGLPATPATARPFLHVSGMFPAEQGCLALMWPLAMHPHNKNELLAWNLAHDPRELAAMNAADIRLRLFSASKELPKGVTRLAIKGVHLNKSPMVFGNLKVLSPAQAQRWGLDVQAQLQNAQLAQSLPDMSGIWPDVFSRTQDPATDADEALYDGFIGDADRHRLNQLRAALIQGRAQPQAVFDDPRLPELVFRYRARNFPNQLSADEQARWEKHRVQRLLEGVAGARTLQALADEIDALSLDASEQAQAILGALYDYAETVAPSWP